MNTKNAYSDEEMRKFQDIDFDADWVVLYCTVAWAAARAGITAERAGARARGLTGARRGAAAVRR